MKAREWRWLRLRPVVATPRMMGVVAGGFYLTGALVAVVSSVWARPQPEHPLAVRLVAMAAVVAGAAVILIRRRPAWTYHVFNIAGTALVTFIIVLTGSSPAALAIATIYLFVPLDSFFFFPLRAAVAYQLWGLLALAATVAIFHVLPLVFALGLGIVETVAAFVVARLVRAAGAAEVDATTDLPNRRGYDRALALATSSARRTEMPLSVAFIDLDHFKAVNDADGHVAGDRMLRTAADVWHRITPESGLLARQGGDEFALMLPGFELADATAVAERMRAAAVDHGFTCSAGVAQWAPGLTCSTLMSRADIALYRAKRDGRNLVYSYDHGPADTDLRRALAAGEFRVAYQPTVCLRTRRLTGAEALLRWDHPERGTISPAEFIPLAERGGAICDLGRFVLQEACTAAVQSLPADAYIAVNVSGNELTDPGYTGDVLHALATTGLPPSRLVLEVTETTLGADAEGAMRVLRRLRALGVRVAIDDFGVGYSSLSRLNRLPIDILKLDRSFVAALGTQERHGSDGEHLVRAIAGLADAVRLSTVAEGIEDEAQAQRLARYGFAEGQGYLFGRPGAIADLLVADAPTVSA